MTKVWDDDDIRRVTMYFSQEKHYDSIRAVIEADRLSHQTRNPLSFHLRWALNRIETSELGMGTRFDEAVAALEATEPPKNCELCRGSGFMFNDVCTPQSCGYYADHVAVVATVEPPPPTCTHSVPGYCEVCHHNKMTGESV